MPTSQLPSLTERQCQVLKLLAQGATDRDVAARLGISPRTVHYHTAGIYERLAARNRAEAVAIAYNHGLLPDKSTRA